MVMWKIGEHPTAFVLMPHLSPKSATSWSELCSSYRGCQLRKPHGSEINNPLLKSSPFFFLVARNWPWLSHLPLFAIAFSCFFSQQNSSWVTHALEPVPVPLLKQLGQGHWWPTCLLYPKVISETSGQEPFPMTSWQHSALLTTPFFLNRFTHLASRSLVSLVFLPISLALPLWSLLESFYLQSLRSLFSFLL